MFPNWQKDSSSPSFLHVHQCTYTSFFLSQCPGITSGNHERSITERAASQAEDPLLTLLFLLFTSHDCTRAGRTKKDLTCNLPQILIPFSFDPKFLRQGPPGCSVFVQHLALLVPKSVSGCNKDTNNNIVLGWRKSFREPKKPFRKHKE